MGKGALISFYKQIKSCFSLDSSQESKDEEPEEKKEIDEREEERKKKEVNMPCHVSMITTITGCEITKNNWISFRKATSKNWLSAALSGFPKRIGKPCARFGFPRF